MDDETRQRILAANDCMTARALRVLGVAYRLVPAVARQVRSPTSWRSDLVFAGPGGHDRPGPRPRSSRRSQRRAQAGIRTIMITGDYPNTAKAIAEEHWPAAARATRC